MAPAPLHTALDAVAAAGARTVVVVLRGIYWLLKRLPAQDKIMLASRLYTATARDFATLQNEIARQSRATKVVVLNHRNTNSLRVPFQMLGEMYHLSAARACITDSYIAAISVLRHKD